MEQPSERRSCRRVLMGAEQTIRFKAKGHAFRNVRITNISSTGCFAMVSQRDAALFAQGAFLEDFAFEHPDLAMGPVLAKVMYTLGSPSEVADLEFMGVGIHFASMDGVSTQRLEDFLSQHP